MANKNIYVEQRILHSIINNALDGTPQVGQQKDFIINQVDDVLLCKKTHKHLDVAQRSEVVKSSFKDAFIHMSSSLSEKEKTQDSKMTKNFSSSCSGKMMPGFMSIAKKHLGPSISMNNSIKKSFESIKNGNNNDFSHFKFPIRQILQSEHEFFKKNQQSTSYKNSQRYKDFKSIMGDKNLDGDKLHPLALNQATSKLIKDLKNQPWEDIANKTSKSDLEDTINDFSSKFNLAIHEHAARQKISINKDHQSNAISPTLKKLDNSL